MATFSPQSAQRFAHMINEPKSKDPRKHNLNGHKEWLSHQFKNIGLEHSDPRSTEFNRIRESAMTSIEESHVCREEPQFGKAWANHLHDLEAI